MTFNIVHGVIRRPFRWSNPLSTISQVRDIDRKILPTDSQAFLAFKCKTSRYAKVVDRRGCENHLDYPYVPHGASGSVFGNWYSAHYKVSIAVAGTPYWIIDPIKHGEV